MTFREWLQAVGFEDGTLTDHQRGVLRALFDRKIAAAAQPDAADPEMRIEAAQWSARYVNDLPDSAFLYVEPGGKKDSDGKTTPRTLRHFPYKNDRGEIDLPHLRNAIAQGPKAKDKNGKPLARSIVERVQKKARQLLERAEKREAKAALAGVPAGEIELAAAELEITTTAADADGDDGEKLPRFRMLAYTGVAMDLLGWLHPVVVDMQGLKIRKGPKPVLLHHSRDAVIGHTDQIEIDSPRLRVAGVISGSGPAAREVVESGRRGFPWQASIGAKPVRMEFVPAGKSAEANGKRFTGPVYIARKAVLGEISFAALGADENTTAKVAATAGAHRNGETDMNFEKWLQANGFDAPEELSEKQRETLRAAYDAEQNGDGDDGTEGDGKKAGSDGAAEHVQANQPPDVKAAAEAAIQAERERVGMIEAACRGFEGDRVQELRGEAMSGQLSPDDLRSSLLEHLRSQRAAISPTTEQRDAMCGEQAIDAAAPQRSLGIQEFCARAALLDGVQLGRYQQDPTGWLGAAFSTAAVSEILSNVANKSLLEGYGYVEDAWRQIAKIASVKDFKLHTRYRLTGDMAFEKVGPDGELKHGTVDEQSFTNQADTWGRMFGITRQMIINDDMGAFAAPPTKLGMGAGEAVASGVWTLLLSNPSSFFHANNKNYKTGATSALSIDGLTLAEQVFLDQTKPNGRPLGVPPKRLLVPTALKVTAEQLMASLKLTEGGGSSASKVPTDNPHAGKFTIACSAYLGNAAISGYSQKAWYLLADPNVLTGVEVAFLNGVDRPTVEKADADFNTLGVQFRGYIDFGIAMQDPRAAVKMKGEN